MTIPTSTSTSRKPHILVLAVAFYLGKDYRPEMKQINDELVDAGYDPVCISLENTPEYDAKLKQALDNGPYELVMVGGGVRKQTEWYGRVTEMVAESSSRDAVMAKPNVPDEAVKSIQDGLPSGRYEHVMAI